MSPTEQEVEAMSSRKESAAAPVADRMTVGGDEIAFAVTTEQSGGAVAALEVRMAPGGGPPMLHRHDPFELYRVDDGELTFYVAGEDGIVRRDVAGPGRVVAIPSGAEHTIRNESDSDARAFVVFSPGGPMERFAREASAMAASGHPDMGALGALAAAHGIVMTRHLDDAVGGDAISG